MAKDKFEILGPAYEEIGLELAEIVGGNPDGVYLYAEAGKVWYEYGIFKDEGKVVRYYDPSPHIGDLIQESWLIEEPAKRWAVMEYEIVGTKFDAKFKYPEEVDVEAFDDDRRETALKKRYGDKPMIYPPWPGQEPAE